jgi:DNA-binding transcriptional LysR family regulator
VELHQLKCFLAVIEEGGFNRATTRLRMTQPALSYQIKQLEQELGAALFHRRPGGVSPTEAGRVLSQHVRGVMESVRLAQLAVQELAPGVVGEVRIGSVNSVGTYFLPEVLRTMRERYPGARPTVLYRPCHEVMEALLAHDIDLAIVANPKPDRRLRQEVILEERVSLVCSNAHPFHGRKNVRPSELRGADFVSLAPENPTGRLIREYLAKLGVNIEPVASTDNVETVKKMVEVGLGVAFLPDMVTAADVACGGNGPGTLVRVEVGPPMVRRICLVTWKQPATSRAIAAFVEELRQHGKKWKPCAEAAAR